MYARTLKGACERARQVVHNYQRGDRQKVWRKKIKLVSQTFEQVSTLSVSLD